MTNYCLRTFFIGIFLFVAAATYGQRINIGKETPIRPFEDYSKCQTGFIRNGKDTVFRAKFENLTAVTVGKSDDVFGKPENNYFNNYNRSWYVNQSNAWILSENGKFGCLSDKGKWIIPCLYEDLAFDLNSLQFIAKLNGKYGVISLSQESVIPFEFDGVEPFQYMNIQDRWYDSLYVSRFRVSKNKLFGVYTIDGKEIIPPIYPYIQNAQRLNFGKAVFVGQIHKFGLCSEDGELIIEPNYESIELLEEWVKPEWNSVFRAKDSMDRITLFNEQGKQLASFENSIIYPVYTYSSVTEHRSVSFVERVDTLEKRQLVSLATGKVSDWYDEVKFVGNQVIAFSLKDYNIDGWKVLDSNFNVVYTNSRKTDQLLYFDDNNRLEEINRFPRHYGGDGYQGHDQQWFDYFGLSHEPLVFVIRKSAILSKRQQQRLDRTDNEYLALFNAKTGQHSPFVYKDIQRFVVPGQVYYWCYRVSDYSDWSGNTVDVYDSLGVFIQTVCLDNQEEEAVAVFHDFYGYPSRGIWPLIAITNENYFSGIIHINGTRTLPNIIEGNLGVLSMSNDSTGVLEASGLGGYRFFNLQGKPLLNGASYDRFVNHWSFFEARKDSIYTLLTPDLKVILDSCSRPFQLDHLERRVLKSNMYRPLVTIKNNFIYIFWEDGKFRVMDSSVFARPATINQIQKGLYVDETGRITDSVPEVKPSTYHVGNIYLTLIKSNLKIEDSKHKLIQTIPNIQGYSSRGNYVVLSTLDKKQGFLNSSTGKWLFDPKYTKVDHTWSSGCSLLWAMEDKDTLHWMVIKEDGTPVTTAMFDYTFVFEGGKPWALFRMNGKMGIINRELQVQTEAMYERMILVNQKSVLIKYDKTCHMIDRATGKSFPINHSISGTNYAKGYLFLFNDSIQIISFSGEELLAPSKVSEVISTVSFVNLLSHASIRATSLPNISNHLIFVPDSNATLIRLSNEVLLQNSMESIFSIAEIAKTTRSLEVTTPKCWIEPIWISKNYYSEKIDGKCFRQPMTSGGYPQRFSYRNYEIQATGTVELKLEDLFQTGVNWTKELDKLIENEIQINQIFGTNCADMPAAVVEFKRNFYLDQNYLTFYSYSVDKMVRVHLSKLKAVLKHPEFFEIGN